MIISHTPWETYNVDGIRVHVKREDLCSPPPGPSFSKVRGLEPHLRKLQDNGVRAVGVLDSRHSHAGWGTAWLCGIIGLRCLVYYPALKGDHLEPDGLRESQRHARELGAFLRPIGPTAKGVVVKGTVMWHWAKRMLATETNGRGVMLPNGLTLPECADGTREEAVRYTPDDLKRGTWVVSVSSGNIAKGLVMALREWDDPAVLVAHMGFSRSEMSLRSVLNYPRLHVEDEGYAYKTHVDFPCPFPCNPYYDLKAWKWLNSHAHELEQPIAFWNIGA